MILRLQGAECFGLSINRCLSSGEALCENSVMFSGDEAALCLHLFEGFGVCCSLYLKRMSSW